MNPLQKSVCRKCMAETVTNEYGPPNQRGGPVKWMPSDEANWTDKCVLCPDGKRRKFQRAYNECHLRGVHDGCMKISDERKQKYMQIGDIVEPTCTAGILRSGAQAYEEAIVASQTPFILVSTGIDMLWGRMKPEHFSVRYKASDEVMSKAMTRADKYLERPPAMHIWDERLEKNVMVLDTPEGTMAVWEEE